MKSKILKLLSPAAILAAGALSSQGGLVYTASDASGRSASATFNQVGTTLTLTLQNTATGDLSNGDNPFLLGALFFSLPGDPSLTVSSETLSSGSRYIYPVATSPNDVTGKWVYGAGAGMPGGATEGISAVGYGVAAFGSVPNGGDYTLTTTDDATGTPSGFHGLFHPVIQSGVTFTFDLPAGYTLTSVNNIGFQYGTSLTDDVRLPPNGGPVPDGGSTIALLGFALVGADLIRRKVVKA